MNILEHLHQTFLEVVQSFSSKQLDDQITFQLNVDDAKQQFGDISSNAALVLTKIMGKPPRTVATALIAAFCHPAVAKIEIAGPGFLNIFLTQEALNQLAADIFSCGDLFFKLSPSEKRASFNIEFVSANPTGPLHLGSGRGGIIGDVLANVIQCIGHTVVREYYINDAGVQMHKLGVSLKVRCQQAAGLEVAFPEDGYAGTYLIDLAQRCIAQHTTAVINKPDQFFSDYAEQYLLEQIKETLRMYGITYDVWFSEKTLHADGSIPATLVLLEQHGHLFQQDGALWFRATSFGDSKDRVLRKASGEYTYVAADAAYLKNKIDRGFDVLIMVLGHDHHGYTERLQGLRKALGYSTIKLSIILNQLVKMKSEGELVRMSKRAGTLVTLADVIETVGSDVARFFYLNRKADAQLEFDLDLALKKTDENPVYYVQYAYVRACSILAKAAALNLEPYTAHDASYLGEQERIVIKKIVELKQLLSGIANHYHTHQLAHYAIELATVFHRYYAVTRIIESTLSSTMRARLMLITTVRSTLELVLRLLNISRPTSM